jgi:DNA gyrase/topoisomerase IV subunit B
LPEYEKWTKSEASARSYDIKYYKGLGTSTAREAKEYFSHLDDHEVRFGILKADTLGLQDLYGENVANVVDVAEDEDGEIVVPDKTVSGSDLIDMVFKKGKWCWKR